MKKLTVFIFTLLLSLPLLGIINIKNTNAQEACGFVFCPSGYYCDSNTTCQPGGSQPVCACSYPSTSDQGCAANGCPAGTRRMCYCLTGSSGACQPNVSSDGLWNCYCEEDPTCGTTDGGGTTTGGGDVGTPCTVTAPFGVTLLGPADGSTLVNNRAPLSWENIAGGWGEGCPTVRSYRVRYKLLSAGNPDCTGGNWTSIYVDNTVKNFNLGNLLWNEVYCWRIVRHNGSASTSSATWTFRTPPTPQILSFGFTNPDVCGTGISGRYTTSGTTNPVTFTMQFQKPSTYLFDRAFIALVPTTGSYAENATYVDNSIIQTKAGAANTLTFRFRDINNIGFYSLTSDGSSWTGPFNSGDLLNDEGNSTLLNLNSNPGSYIVNGATTVDATFNFRFENNFPTGTYNIYIAGNFRSGAGNVSTNEQPGHELTYTKVGQWSVDTVNPSVSISNPLIINQNQFQSTFTATDINGIKDLRSYVYSNVAGTSLRNDTHSYQINSIPTVEQNYPANPDNLGITQARLGSNTFTDLTPTLSANYALKLVAQDNACNVSTATNSIVPSEPWILSVNSTISANGGFANVKIPNTNFNVPLSSYFNRGVASTDLLLSGTTDLPNQNISGQNKYSQSYINLASKPRGTEFTNWYDFYFDKITTQDIEVVQSINGNSNVLGGSNISNIFPANTAREVGRIGGSLTINSNAICDKKMLILVNGNLSITPNFTNSNTNSACIFIVKGNVSIQNGPARTITSLSSSTYANYDEIQATIITNGSFTTFLENSLGANVKWDGLRVIGTIVANTVNLQKDLNTTANQTQPSHIFIYDARYREAFADILQSTKYSIREDY